MNGSNIQETSKYLTLKSDMKERRDYIERAIKTIKEAPTHYSLFGDDEIIVSREAMLYVLERAKDGVDVADGLNETIHQHNMLVDTSHQEVEKTERSFFSPDKDLSEDL